MILMFCSIRSVLRFIGSANRCDLFVIRHIVRVNHSVVTINHSIVHVRRQIGSGFSVIERSRPFIGRTECCNGHALELIGPAGYGN
jgi:hypothetical protein